MAARLIDTLRQIIESAPLDEVTTLLTRLRDLPEFGLNHEVNNALEQFEIASQKEEEARCTRQMARDRAIKLLRRVTTQWSESEITDATGY